MPTLVKLQEHLMPVQEVEHTGTSSTINSNTLYDSQQDQIQEFGSCTGWTNQVKANLIECSSFCPVIPMAMHHPYDNYNILTFKTIAYDQKTTNAHQAIIHVASTQPWDIYDYSGMLDIFNEISDFEKETKTNKDLLY